jgi:glycerol kinase
MTSSDEFLQTLADVSQIKVMKSKEQQITILGAAVAAGLQSEVGIWKDFDELKKYSQHEQNYIRSWSQDVQIKKFEKWNKAVERTKEWI